MLLKVPGKLRVSWKLWTLKIRRGKRISHKNNIINEKNNTHSQSLFISKRYANCANTKSIRRAISEIRRVLAIRNAAAVGVSQIFCHFVMAVWRLRNLSFGGVRNLTWKKERREIAVRADFYRNRRCQVKQRKFFSLTSSHSISLRSRRWNYRFKMSINYFYIVKLWKLERLKPVVLEDFGFILVQSSSPSFRSAPVGANASIL